MAHTQLPAVNPSYPAEQPPVAAEAGAQQAIKTAQEAQTHGIVKAEHDLFAEIERHQKTVQSDHADYLMALGTKLQQERLLPALSIAFAENKYSQLAGEDDVITKEDFVRFAASLPRDSFARVMLEQLANVMQNTNRQRVTREDLRRGIAQIDQWLKNGADDRRTAASNGDGGDDRRTAANNGDGGEPFRITQSPDENGHQGFMKTADGRQIFVDYADQKNPGKDPLNITFSDENGGYVGWRYNDGLKKWTLYAGDKPLQEADSVALDTATGKINVGGRRDLEGNALDERGVRIERPSNGENLNASESNGRQPARAPAAHNREQFYIAQGPLDTKLRGEYFSCGPTSLGMAIADWTGVAPTQELQKRLIDETNTLKNGLFVGDTEKMREYGAAYGLQGRTGVGFTKLLEDIKSGKSAIVNGPNHFVYVAGIDSNGNFIVGEPAEPNKGTWSEAELRRFFGGGGWGNAYLAVWADSARA
ncbi:MAG TPA: C39 family peptidase [Candidatus Obscuribacterales bacterium]